MNSKYKGYDIIEDEGKWCVNLGIEIGTKCFNSLDDAKEAIDSRLQEIEEGTRDRP